MTVNKYSGPFGYMKPFFAVRDELTISRQFILPSMLRHLEIMMSLPKGAIVDAKLAHQGINIQQEVTHTAEYRLSKKYKPRERSILRRGVMLVPEAYLLFDDQQAADVAFAQCFCLSRNEDIMIGQQQIEINPEDFKSLPGLRFQENEKGIFAGYYFGLQAVGIEDLTPIFGTVTTK